MSILTQNKRIKKCCTVFFILSLLACCSCLFVPPTFAATNIPNEKVSLHLRWHHQFQFAGYYAAIEKGFYADEGLDVELLEVKRGTGIIEPVIDGTAEYGVADGSLLAARAKGDPVVLLAQIFQHSPQIFLSLRETGIYTPDDLRGKTVMFAQDNTSWNLLFSEIIGHSEYFEIVPPSYDLNDLIDGKVDIVAAYLTNEPYQLQKIGIKYNILHPRGYGIDYFGDNLFTSEVEALNHPQRVAKMARASLKGWEYALNNKNEIIDLIIRKYAPDSDRDKLVYEAQVTEQMISPDSIPLGKIDQSRYKTIAKDYAHIGLIDSPEIPTGFIYQSPKRSQLQLSAAEQKWLTEHPDITFGTGQDWEPIVIAEDDGSFSGIEADIIQRINQIAGTNIRIVVDEWPKVVEKAKAREIDGLLSSTAQETRAPYFLFTNSLINAYKFIFTTNVKITALDDLKGKRVGYQRGILIHEKFLEQQSGVIPVPLDSLAALALQLQKKQVDAVLGGNILKYYLQERMFVEGFSTYIVPRSKVKTLYSIRKDWPELHSIVNKALAQISPEEVTAIKKKWIFHEDSSRVEQVLLSEEEQAWLKANPDIALTFADSYEPYLFSNPDGTKSGTLVNFLAQLNERLGTDIRLSLGTLDQNLTKVKEGNAEGVLSLHHDYSDKLGFLKTRNYLKVYPALFANRGLTLDAPADLSGKKIAHIKSEYYSRKIIDQYGQNATIVTVDHPLDGLRMAAAGDVDVFIGLSSTAYYITKYQLSGLVSKYIFFETPIDFAMAVRPDLPELVPILNKGLASFSEQALQDLTTKWLNTPVEQVTDVQLSVTEKAWLADKHTVHVRMLDIPPFIILKKGTAPQGITIDYLTLLSERTGIHFDYQPSEKPFSEALEDIKNHQGPDLMPTIVSTPERKQSILFTENYISSPNMIFIRSGGKQLITKIDDLVGRKIAILKGSVQYNMVRNDYPGLDIVPFGSDLEAMQAVTNGHADAYIGTLILAGYHILHRGLYNLQLAAPTPFPDHPISMGVRNDWPELASIMNKGLASISPTEHETIRNRYISLQYNTSNTGQYIKWFLLTAGVSLAVIGFFFLWNRSLAKQVSASTAQLKESAKRYRRVLESTSTVPWERDLKSGNFTFMGKQVEQMLGYPAESWSDFTVWAERLHPEDKNEAIQYCENEIKNRKDHEFTYRVLHIDGSYRWIRDVVSVTQEMKGPIKLVGFMHDITEKKELTLEREQLEKQWEQTQKLEAVGTLAGGIAHDFNNILSAILGFTELAKDSAAVDSEIADDLDEVLHAAHRAKELVQQILAFSRQSQIEPAPLKPQLIIKEGLKMLRSSLPTTIEIKENIAPDCGMVLAVPAQIHQILINLCTNAFHAMEEKGGTMTVEMKQAEYVPLELGNSSLGYIELSVGDTGQGIGPQILDKIFDPFFTTKEQGKGTGMGLSIIYGIVKDHGGKITVESAEGKGTTFHVYLPRCEEATSHTETSEANITGGKESILFIDDERGIAKAGKAMLEKMGYEVTIKTDSFEALKTFQKHPAVFDLIITDQTMPGMTGFDLAKRMLRIRPDIPIILCTGYSSIVNEGVAKSLGIREFTTKPMSKNIISTLIRKVLDKP